MALVLRANTVHQVVPVPSYYRLESKDRSKLESATSPRDASHNLLPKARGRQLPGPFQQNAQHLNHSHTDCVIAQMERRCWNPAASDVEWDLPEAACPGAPAPPADTAQPAVDSPAPCAHAPRANASRFLRALPSELLPRILSLLPPNDLAGSVRLVCRDALDACHETLLMQHAALMPSVTPTVPPPLCCCTPTRHLPHHHLQVPMAPTQPPCTAAKTSPEPGTTATTSTSSHASTQKRLGLQDSTASEGCPLCPRFTIRLSQPVPPALFAWRWAHRAATNGLTANQRLQLWRLTVATGVLQNVRVLRRRTEVNCWQSKDDFTAAARSGNVGLVRLLSRTVGYLKDQDAALQAAAAAGRTEVCCWLLSTRSARKHWQNLDVRKILFEFHDTIYPDTARSLLKGAAAGFPVGVLTSLYGTFIAAVHGLFRYDTDRELTSRAMLRAAATSATPDWRAKAAWVLGEFFSPPHGPWAAVAGSGRSNAVRHDCAAAAAAAAAAQRQAPGPGGYSGSGNSSGITGSSMGCGQGQSSGSRLSLGSNVCTAVAAGPGALPRLQWLQERGCPLDSQAVLRQVVCVSGDPDVLTHLLQHHGVVPGPQEVQRAACFGHMEVLQVLLRNHPYGRGMAGSAAKPDGGGGRGPGGEGPGGAAGGPAVGGDDVGGGAGEGAPRAMGPGARVDDPLQQVEVEDEEMRGWFRRAVLSAAWCGQVHVLAWLARARRELLAPPPQLQQAPACPSGFEAVAAAAAVFPTAQEVLSAVLWDDAIGCPPTREPLANSRGRVPGRGRGRRGGAAGTRRHPPGLGLPEVWSGQEWWKRHFGSISSSEAGGCDADQQQHRRQRLVLLQQTPEQRVLRTLLWLRHEGTWWPWAPGEVLHPGEVLQPGEVLLQRTWRAPDAAVEWLRRQGVRVEREEVCPTGDAADDESEVEDWEFADMYSEPWVSEVRCSVPSVLAGTQLLL